MRSLMIKYLFNKYSFFRFQLKMSEVQQFYKGKNIFITGGTGFLGICLIEKILRAIPDIGKIYLLMRPKKGIEITARLEDLTKNKVCPIPLTNRYVISCTNSFYNYRSSKNC